MFDLPTTTKDQRHAYARFRSRLVRDGFQQMQYSVYARHSATKQNARVHLRRIVARMPREGEVRVLVVTDRQFERMQVFSDRVRQAAEAAPNQLMFW